MSAYLVELILEARQSGRRIASLPRQHVPPDAKSAYALQDAVAERLGMRYGGWKVGAGGAVQAPVCAPIFVADIAPSPAHILAWPGGLNGVEGEIVVKMGGDLPLRTKPYSVEEAWEAVASLHAGIEYVEPRFADIHSAPPLAFLVDRLGNGGLIYGPAAPTWQSFDLDRPESWLFVGGEEKSHKIAGSASGNPRSLLAWLANHCAERGHMLKAGDFITTGSHTGLELAPVGSRVKTRFQGLGEAELTLLARCDP